MEPQYDTTYSTGSVSCPLLVFHIYGCLQLALPHPPKATLGIVSLLSWPKMVALAKATCNISFLFFSSTFSLAPIPPSRIILRRGIFFLRCLGHSMVTGFALGCPGVVIVVLVAALLFPFDWVQYSLCECILASILFLFSDAALWRTFCIYSAGGRH